MYEVSDPRWTHEAAAAAAAAADNADVDIHPT